MKRLSVLVLLCLTLVLPGAALADNLARDYIPAPPDTLAVLLYYTHSSSDSLYAHGDKVANVDFTGNVGLFRPVYYMMAGPFEIDPQFILPFGNLNLEAKSGNLDLSTSSVGDPILFATIWFLNDPKSKTWLGFTPFFFIPIGDYQNHGLLSLGENRWRFREELGFVKGFEVIPEHNAYFELQVGGDFFTKNDSFGKLDQDMNQDPIFNLESHLSYDLTKALFVSADYYYHGGGETEVGNFKQDDSLSNSILGMTLGFNIAPNYQLLFQYKGDVHTESGLQTQAFTFRFLYACDLGSLTGKATALK